MNGHTQACTSHSYQMCCLLLLSHAYGLWTPVTFGSSCDGESLDTGISFVLLWLLETILNLFKHLVRV